MKRNDLFEFHEQDWFPEYLRNEVTLLLKTFWTLQLPSALAFLSYTPSYQIVCRKLHERLASFNGNKKAKKWQVVDICSGAGGPVIQLAKFMKEEMKQDIDYVLTDLFPNQDVIQELEKEGGSVRYERDPVDAAKLPMKYSSLVRTSYGSFHHLPKAVATNIFKDVINSKSGIFIVEITERSIFVILLLIVLLPILSYYSLLVNIRPFSLKRFFFYFVIPLIPIVMTVDGVLSCLRTYEEEDYLSILKDIDGAFEKFEWKYEKIRILNHPFLSKLNFGLSIFSGIPK